MSEAPTPESVIPHTIEEGILVPLRAALADQLYSHEAKALSATTLKDFRRVLAAVERRQSVRSDGRQFQDAAGELRQFFLRQPTVPITLLYQPRNVMARLIEGRNEGDLPVSLDLAIERWRLLAAIADTLWHFLNEPEQERRLPPTALLLAARMRFLVLSEPFRHRGLTTAPWLPEDLRVEMTPNGLLGSVFGKASWPELVARCRESREIWHRYLDSYESFPAFSEPAAKMLEYELRLLALEAPSGRDPLSLSALPLTEPARPEPADRAVLHRVVVNHLLPRFALGSVWKIVMPGPSWLAALPVVLAVGSILTAILVDPMYGAVAAAVLYVLAAGPTLWFGRIWTTPWLFRIPAACSIGMFLVITLPPEWWEDASSLRLTVTVTAGLVCAPFLYLLVQAKNHNVASKRTLWRVVAVTGVGLLHAWLVTLIGMTVLMPLFSESGTMLLALLGSGWQAQLSVLCPAVALNFAVGVFTQLLWDNRPITAPLAHASWTESR